MMNYWFMPGLLGAKTPSLDMVLDAVCSCMGIQKEAILGRKRYRELVAARQLYCYVARKMTKENTTSVAKFIGIDHSTVSYSTKNVNRLLSVKDEYINKEIIKKIEFLVENVVNNL